MTRTLSMQCGKSAAAERETHTMRRTPRLALRRRWTPATAGGNDV